MAVHRSTELHDVKGIILFDGICNLCNRSVQWLIARDTKARFRFGTLQNAAARELVESVRVEQRDMGTVLYVKDGRVLDRSTAALTILKDLGGLWSLTYAFIIVPPVLRDAVYRWVARNRYKWFGQRSTCMVPTPELRSRFLDGSA